MGLDTTHNCWHGPYSSFNRFRRSLGHQIGIELNDYHGYDGRKFYLEQIRHDLMPLLNHSDCDGKLSVKECKRLVKGFNDVLENFVETIEHDYNFKEQIIQFRDGCISAIEQKQKVKFQ